MQFLPITKVRGSIAFLSWSFVKHGCLESHKIHKMLFLSNDSADTQLP